MSADTAVPGRRDLELTLATSIVRRALYVAPVLIGFFWLVRGWDGAWASAIGVAVVVVNFWASGKALSMAARHSLAFYHAAALFGFILRLGLITITMIGVASVVDVDRRALGVTAVVSYLALLIWEAVALTSERDVE
ncbi:MAG: hypothetical protein V3R84_04355 [Acidimicrobiia bacterium]